LARAARANRAKIFARPSHDGSRAMTKSIALICLGSLLSAHVTAQTLYRSTMPDGRVIYAEKPVPGAARTTEVAPPMPTSGIGGTVLRLPSKEESGGSSVRGKGEGSRTAAIETAEENLRKAEQARRQGLEPGGADRAGNAKGGTRLSDSYWERQGKLEEAVEKAKQELDQLRTKQ
jgi:hypothetical protein